MQEESEEKKKPKSPTGRQVRVLAKLLKSVQITVVVGWLGRWAYWSEDSGNQNYKTVIQFIILVPRATGAG